MSIFLKKKLSFFPTDVLMWPTFSNSGSRKELWGLRCPFYFENQLTNYPRRFLVLSQILLWMIKEYSWLRLDLLSSQGIRLICAQNLISCRAEFLRSLLPISSNTYVRLSPLNFFATIFQIRIKSFLTHLPISYCTALSFLSVRSAIAGAFFLFCLLAFCSSNVCESMWHHLTRWPELYV